MDDNTYLREMQGDKAADVQATAEGVQEELGGDDTVIRDCQYL